MVRVYESTPPSRALPKADDGLGEGHAGGVRLLVEAVEGGDGIADRGRGVARPFDGWLRRSEWMSSLRIDAAKFCLQGAETEGPPLRDNPAETEAAEALMSAEIFSRSRKPLIEDLTYKAE